MSGIALPAIRTVEFLHQAGGIKSREARDSSQRSACGIDAINASLVVPRAKIEAVFDVVGNPFRMFDDQSIHVGDVERAIGSGLEHGWAKPVIFGGEKFAVFFVGRTMARETDAVWFK